MTEGTPQEFRLEGEKIILRDRRLEDLADYERWLVPGAEWKRWDAPWWPAQVSDEDRAEWEPGLERVRLENPLPRRILEIETRSGEHIGMVSRYWVSEVDGWAEVGLVIWDPQHWSRGLGSEALTLWLNHQFSSGSWHRLGLGTWSGNRRMVRQAERLGFTLEARIRQARAVEGQRYDALSYGLLREEWTTQPWARILPLEPI